MPLIDQLIDELKKNPQKLEEFLSLFRDKITSLALEELNRKIDILLKDREEIFKRFEEHDKKFEEIVSILKEHSKRLEEHDKKFIEIVEEIKAIKLEMKKMNKRLSTVEINLGFLTESFAIDFFTRYLNEKVISITRHYQIDNKEIDAVIETENRYFLVEVRSRVSPHDVIQMYSISNKFLKEAKKEVRPTILGVRVKNEAIEVGKKLGIEVIRI
ncbi:MAG: hypothetical protein JZD40_07490 [Sulfolobus sp.]|nr:hypothetical protein [Sulfolobus sp.]